MSREALRSALHATSQSMDKHCRPKKRQMASWLGSCQQYGRTRHSWRGYMPRLKGERGVEGIGRARLGVWCVKRFGLYPRNQAVMSIGICLLT